MYQRHHLAIRRCHRVIRHLRRNIHQHRQHILRPVHHLPAVQDIRQVQDTQQARSIHQRRPIIHRHRPCIRLAHRRRTHLDLVAHHTVHRACHKSHHHIRRPVHHHTRQANILQRVHRTRQRLPNIRPQTQLIHRKGRHTVQQAQHIRQAAQNKVNAASLFRVPTRIYRSTIIL